MFGQISLVIIILLFTLGSLSITISLLTEHNNTPVYIPAKPYVKNNIADEVFLTDEDSGILQVESEIIEDKKPISDILESFSMEDLEVEDDIVDIHQEDILLDDD